MVTSGAIARGMGVMALPVRPRAVEELQAASAVGQGKLYQVYDELLRARGVPTAQVLLTFFDISARTHYLNARQTLRKLLEWRVVPVINENDTTTTDEISFGNNDFLAAQVAILLGAEQLVMLTDAEGVFTADPRSSPGARADLLGRRVRRSRRSRHRTCDVAARVRRHAVEGRGGRDGHRRRDPHGDRQRARARHADRGGWGPAGRHRVCGAVGPLLELQAVAEVRQAGARARGGRRGRGARPARRRHQPAAGGHRRRRGRLRRRRRGRDRARRRDRRQGDLQLLRPGAADRCRG